MGPCEAVSEVPRIAAWLPAVPVAVLVVAGLWWRSAGRVSRWARRAKVRHDNALASATRQDADALAALRASMGEGLTAMAAVEITPETFD